MVESTSAGRVVIYVRMPKTAGSSLTTLLSDLLRPVVQIEDPLTLWRFLSLSSQEKDSLQLVFGHMPYGVHRFLRQEPYYLVFLRHPVDRIVSNYYYVKAIRDHPLYKKIADGMSLAAFATLPENSNAQIRRLGKYDITEALEPRRERDYWWIARHRQEATREFFNEAKECLDACSFVGVQERFNVDVPMLLKDLALTRPAELPFVNRTKVRPPVEEVERDVSNFILDHNLLDFELYQYAREKRRKLSVDASDWRKIPEGISLEKIEIFHAEVRHLAKGIEIGTMAKPWSYAVAIPCLHPFLGPALVTMDIEVKRGSVQVGFISRDGFQIVGAQICDTGRRIVPLLTSELGRADRIIVRNGPAASPAEVVIHEVALSARN